MAKIYLSARYGRRVELCGFAELAKGLGHEITASWLAGPGMVLPNGERLGEHTQSAIEDGDDISRAGATVRDWVAGIDLADVLRSDLLIFFSEKRGELGSRGGRWVEFGAALGRGIPVWIVGGREQNVFSWLSELRLFGNGAQALRALRVLRSGEMAGDHGKR